LPVKTYRKIPVTVEAIQYTNAEDSVTVKEIKEFTGEHPFFTQTNKVVSEPNFTIVGPRNVLREANKWGPDITAAVWDDLHETYVGVKDGDYIIKGQLGEFYPHDSGLWPNAYEEVWS
jgi:hypothetical protein